MQKILRDYNLSLVLVVLFLTTWVAQGYFQWQEFVNEEQEHAQTAELGNFVAPFLSASFENWQSEFLQLFSMVVLTSFLVHKGSAESKDSNEKMEAALARIERQLAQRHRK